MKEAPFSKKNSRRFLAVANCWLLISAIMFVSCSKSDEPLPLAEEIDNDGIEYTFIDPSDTLNVTICEAEDIASAFMDDLVETDNTLKAAGMRYSTRKATIIPDDNNEPAMYVVNLYPEGWCIVSATKKTQSVLAFSDEGKFDVKELNAESGLFDWIDENVEIVQLARKDTNCGAWINSISSNKVVRKNAIFTQKMRKIGPLLNTSWGQQVPYNNKIPKRCFIDNYSGVNVNAYAGCVTIAATQVAKYYGYSTYKSYNWNLMKDKYETTSNYIPINYTNNEANAVATLVADIAYILNADYGCNSTGAVTKNIINVFKKFGYKNSGVYQELSDENAIPLVKSELENGHPVIMRGSSNANVLGGHCWVCDGYRYSTHSKEHRPFFHMNWGWNGSPEGWYNIDYTYVESSRLLYPYNKAYITGIRVE